MRDLEKKKAHNARRHAERMVGDLDYRMRKLWNTINQRCATNTHKSDRYYRAKGIQNFLTVEDLVYLWERDRAYHYRKPSIDRIDVHGNYDRSNCRFIELSLNIRRGKKNIKEGAANG